MKTSNLKSHDLFNITNFGLLNFQQEQNGLKSNSLSKIGSLHDSRKTHDNDYLKIESTSSEFSEEEDEETE